MAEAQAEVAGRMHRKVLSSERESNLTLTSRQLVQLHGWLKNAGTLLYSLYRVKVDSVRVSQGASVVILRLLGTDQVELRNLGERKGAE